MRYSPLETNIFALENGCLEYDPFLLGQKAYFQVRSVSFRECIWKRWIQLWRPKNWFSWWVFLLDSKNKSYLLEGASLCFLFVKNNFFTWATLKNSIQQNPVLWKKASVLGVRCIGLYGLVCHSAIRWLFLLLLRDHHLNASSSRALWQEKVSNLKALNGCWCTQGFISQCQFLGIGLGIRLASA